MGGVWKDDNGNRKNKYLVQRRDGTVPEWPWFVLSAKDPAATAALRAYAIAAKQEGMDSRYVIDVLSMAGEWDSYLIENGAGDPDAPPHRIDNPDVTGTLDK